MDEEKEIPKDLTMLDKGPAPNEPGSEWLNLFNSTEGSSEVSASKPVDSKSAAETAFTDMQKNYLVDASVQQGGYDTELDRGTSMFESQNSARARNQGTGVKALKAVSGGILQGGLVALEQFGYVGDLLGTYTNLFEETGDYSGNQWSNAVKELSEELGNSDAFKIYEEEDPNSIVGQIWKWNSLQSGLSSAVGFGLSGLAASNAIAGLTATKKFKQLFGVIDEALGNRAGKKAIRNALANGSSQADALKLGQAALTATEGLSKSKAAPFMTSVLSNFYMGQMMASDTYKQSLDSITPLIGEVMPDGEVLTREKAEKIANTEAGDAVLLNMALTATGYIKFASIFKRNDRFKSMVQDPTLKWQAKQLIKTGSPVAFVENVYQEMIQMEQIQDTQVSAGMEEEDLEYSTNYWDRMTQLALSDRAVHAGALGLAGGPMQFAIIQRPMMGKQLKEQRKAFKKQGDLRSWQAEVVKNKFETFANYEQHTNDALKAGKLNEAKLIDDIAFINEVVESVQWGTGEAFKHDMEQIMAMTPEEAAGKDLGKNYKETAQEVIDLIDAAYHYNAIESRYVNKEEVVHTRLVLDRVKKARREALERIRTNKDGVRTSLQESVGFDLEYVDNDLVPVRDSNRFEGKSSSEVIKMKQKEAAENKKLAALLKYDVEYKALREDIKDLNKHSKFEDDLNKKYTYITSKEGQQEYSQRTANAEIARKKAEKDGVEATPADQKKKPSHFMSFQELVDSKPNLTTEELKAKTKEWDVEVQSTPDERAVISDETFTGRDNFGTSALYTVGDMRRSHDGRYFVIDAQNEATSKLGDVKGEMPVIYEVNEKGQKLKGAKKVVLRDNSFLRQEVNQVQFKKGKYTKRRDIWAPYTDVDYTLSPNNYSIQSIRAEYAAEGKFRTVNVSGRNSKLPEFAWMQEYNMEKLNERFTEPYDILLRKREAGPNEVYVDVYKLEEGGKEILLTRLDKDYNLAHPDLLNFIDKNNGEVSGKVTEHYSSKFNLNKKLSVDGVPQLSDISELKNLPEHFKVNGEVVLASTKGDRAVPRVDVARSETGETYKDGVIPVMMDNGVIRDMEIPFGSIPPGQTAALIVSPGGFNLIPLILRNKTIGEMPGLNSESASFAEDLAAIHDDAVQEALEELFEGTEESLDETIERELVNANKTPDSQLNPEDGSMGFAIRAEKRKRIAKADGDADNVINKILDRTIYQHVRPRFGEYMVEGSQNGKNVEVSEKTKTGKRQKVRNPNYFVAGFGVGKDGAVTAQLKVRRGEFQLTDPKDPAYVKKNKFEIEYINYSDNPQRYIEVLSQQYKRASIDVLANTAETKGADAKKEMNAFFQNEGLQTDIDPHNPVVGASATITVDSQEFQETSASASRLHKMKIADKFKGYKQYEADVYEESPTESKERIDAAVEAIDEFLGNENNVLNDLTDTDDVIEILDSVRDRVDMLEIYQDFAARKIVSELFKKVPETRMTELKDIKDDLASRGIPVKNQDEIAAMVMAMQDIKTKLVDGTFKLKPKKLVRSESDPTGKYTQQENFTFKRNVEAYHEIHGAVIFLNEITKGKSAGMYKVKKISNGKTYTVFPKETYRKGYDLAELSVLKKKIGRLKDKESEQYKVLTEKRLRLENKIAKRNAYLNKETNEDGTSTETGDATALIEAFTQLGASRLLNETLESLPSSGRLKTVTDYIQELVDFDAMREESSPGIGSPFLEEHATKLDAIYKKLPYSLTDLDALRMLTEDAISRKIDVADNTARLATIESVYKIKEAIANRTNPQRTVEVKYKRISATGKTLKARTSIIGTVKSVKDKGTGSTTDVRVTSEAAQDAIVQVTGLIQKLIVADIALRANLWVSTSSPKAANKPSDKTITLQDVDKLTNEILSNKEIIKAKKDGKIVEAEGDYDMYYNTDTDTELRRVSDIVYDGKVVPDTPLTQSARVIGNGVDVLWRDFFEADGKLDFDSKYAIATEEDFDAYIKEIKAFRNKLKARGETVIAKEVILYDDANKVAGTVDLLTYTKDGKYRIYDMKTMRKNKFTEKDSAGTTLFESQLNKDKSDMDAYTDQMSLYRIMLFNTHNILAEQDVTVLATQVNYEAGHTATTKPKFIKEQKLKARDAVGGVILKSKVVQAADPASDAMKNHRSTNDRPFILDKALKHLKIPVGNKFQTVIGAFFAAKLMHDTTGVFVDAAGALTPIGTTVVEQLAKARGSEVAKIAGNLTVSNAWNAAYTHKLLKDLVIDSFEQNENSKRELLAFDIDTFTDSSITDANYELALQEAKEVFTTSKAKKAGVSKTKTPKTKKVQEPGSKMIQDPGSLFEGKAADIANELILPPMPQEVFDALEAMALENIEDFEDYLIAIDSANSIGAPLNGVFKEIADKGKTMAPQSKAPEGAPKPKSKGFNISSYESGLGHKLSNFAKTAMSFRGKKFQSAEQAYQHFKKDLPSLADEEVLNLMTRIITQKLMQHPNLMHEITAKGGMTFLKTASHNLIKRGSVVKEDRWTGQDGIFMQALRAAYGDMTGSPMFKTGTELQATTEFQREVADAKAMLPNVPLEIVKDVAEMVKKYGVKAIGAFDKGVRYIVNNAKVGTAYHETFHAVAGLYLTAQEKSEMAKERGQTIWDRAFEEKLAEEFEDYVRNYKKPTFTDRVIKFFKKLMFWKNKVVPSNIERVFEKTVTGGYNSHQALQEISIPRVESVEEFSKSLSDTNKVMLQRLTKANKIKIVC